MNKVASLAAVFALVALGVYLYSGSSLKSNSTENITPAALSAAEGGSCCSDRGSEMVSTGSKSCCATETKACCSDKTEMVKTETGSTCCSEDKSEVVSTGAEAKTCPCQGGKTEAVTTGAEKAECHGDCESGCCQEKKTEGEAAKTEGGEGK